MVSLFFGAGAVVCLVPHLCSSLEVLALLYAVVTPMLNPIIDGLRSGEVQGAIRNAPRGGVLQMSAKGASIATEPSPPFPQHRLSPSLTQHT